MYIYVFLYICVFQEAMEIQDGLNPIKLSIQHLNTNEKLPENKTGLSLRY